MKSKEQKIQKKTREKETRVREVKGPSRSVTVGEPLTGLDCQELLSPNSGWDSDIHLVRGASDAD